jgi:hypothetical protein
MTINIMLLAPPGASQISAPGGPYVVAADGTITVPSSLVTTLLNRWDLDAGALVMGGNSVTCQSGSASAAALTSSDIGTTQTKTQLVTVITEGGNTITISR